jgi:hypothetical protein
LAKPIDAAWAEDNLTDTNLNATTPGGGTTFPSTFPTGRPFFNSTLNAFFFNNGTEGTPIWVGIGNGFDERCFSCSDDFIFGTTTAHEIGSLNFFRDANTISYQTINHHPGVLRIATLASAGDEAFICGGTASTILPLTHDMLFDITVMITPVTDVTNRSIRVGVSSDLTTLTPADGIFWFIDTAVDTNWRTKTRTGGSETINNSAIAAAVGTWVKLRIKRLASSVEFYINDSLAFTHTTNLPTTAAGNVFVCVDALAAGAETIDIDYFNLRIEGLNR